MIGFETKSTSNRSEKLGGGGVGSALEGLVAGLVVDHGWAYHRARHPKASREVGDSKVGKNEIPDPLRTIPCEAAHVPATDVVHVYESALIQKIFVVNRLVFIWELDVKTASQKCDKSPMKISPDILDLMCAHLWKKNEEKSEIGGLSCLIIHKRKKSSFLVTWPASLREKSVHTKMRWAIPRHGWMIEVALSRPAHEKIPPVISIQNVS
ncbi:unnamed protein product [Lactuca saligna]|uniref:Uncharacterized protein n=1 Tax=Lactuca saligna TaxID=75948 RepID=A0AA35YMI5_LACSI|nr:unnamed protein product [Lactuca saligna]